MKTRRRYIIEVLAQSTGLSARRVRASILDLERVGVITWHRDTDSFEINITTLEAMSQIEGAPCPE